MRAHLYKSSQNGAATHTSTVIFCEYCGRIAFDAGVTLYERADKLQAEAVKPCPLAPSLPGDKQP